ncbi:MAG: DUF305 domain-containing protein [Hyphomicrobiales bacterium]
MNRPAVTALSLMLMAWPAAADDLVDPAAQQNAAEDSMLGMLTMKAGAEMSEADRGYMKAMQTMQQTLMKIEMTGDASGDFVRMMITHHQSAIDMIDALMAQKDIDPEIREMAERMRAAQAKEIVEMQAWLEKHPK